MDDTTANLVLVGPMGAGKSSIGKRLAQALSLAFVDADRELETRTGASARMKKSQIILPCGVSSAP